MFFQRPISNSPLPPGEFSIYRSRNGVFIMSDVRAVGRPAVGTLTETQRAAGSAAVKSLAGLASSIRVSSHARLPSVVPLSSLAMAKPGSRAETLLAVNSLLQESGGPSLEHLVAQQIPGNDPNATQRKERAENVLLATLISLPPAEREAVMQNPARLQALCKNAIFGSLASNNDKICAICSGNVKKSPAYQRISELPSAVQPLAHRSAQRLEMFMARNPDLDEKQKEALREKAMEFFQKATCEEDVMKFPSPFPDRPDATLHFNARDADMLHFGYLLKSLGEETYKQFDIPDQIHMQLKDGKANKDLTLNAWLQGDAAEEALLIPTDQPRIEVPPPPGKPGPAAPAAAQKPTDPAEVQLRKVDPPREGGQLHQPQLSPEAQVLHKGINDFYRELSKDANGATVHKETKDRLQQLLEYADAFSLSGLQPDADGNFTPEQVKELSVQLEALRGLLDSVRGCVLNCDEGSGEAQLMRNVLQHVSSKIRHELSALEGLVEQMAAKMPKGIEEVAARAVSLRGMVAGLPDSLNKCVQSIDQFISKETASKVIATALGTIDADPARAAQQLQGLLSSGDLSLVRLLLIQDSEGPEREKAGGNRVTEHPLLQKLINKQPEFKAFVQGNPAIKAAFVKAGIAGLD